MPIEANHRLRRERLARGLSQADLARIAGVSQPTVSFLERGLSRPRPRSRVAIARALGIDHAELFPIDPSTERGPTP